MTAANPALEQFIKSIPLFTHVAPEEMLDILRLLQSVELRSGEVLFNEGDPGDAMWVLGAGCEVSISSTPAGATRPVVVAKAVAGGTIGEMALIDDGGRSGTAQVVRGGPAHKIHASDFHVLRDAYEPAAFKVLRRICIDLCARLRATQERIVPVSPAKVRAPGLAAGPRPKVEMLEEYGPFKGMPAVVKLALAHKLQVIDVPEVTPLFAEGEKADAAYFVVQGEVSIGRGGKTFSQLGPGAVIGLVSAIDAGCRSASAVTTGPARLFRLADADFDSLFASGHRFAFRLIDLSARQLVAHLRTANKLLPAQAGAGKPPATAVRSSAVKTAEEAEEPVLLLLEEAEPELLPLELELELKLDSQDEPIVLEGNPLTY